ncbi:hypothetical protein NUW54_g3083 [Trametes sanguinea]|uniref:Uncharacterized protein n=1 Tax=Trametes sanguinea TaxID=158606 RepID=A0ACC1Q4X2_9APHY|nr:hypothetical protein NUW54_g3083 [Trametes sanguinea]
MGDKANRARNGFHKRFKFPLLVVMYDAFRWNGGSQAIGQWPTAKRDETGAEESPESLSPRTYGTSGAGDGTLMPSPSLMSRRLRRRHTEGDSSPFDVKEGGFLQGLPASSRKIFRQVAVVFRPRRKTVSSASPPESLSEVSSASASGTSLSSNGDLPVDIDALRVEGPERLRRTPSVHEDAVEIRVSSVATAIINAATTGARAPTPIKNLDEKIDCSSDPAYAALMPILYELDALAENPRCKAIAAQNDDDDYRQFWETFSQLSAKDVLCAVYAIRAGALEMPDISDSTTTFPVAGLLCALWGLLASTLALYLYLRVPV